MTPLSVSTATPEGTSEAHRIQRLFIELLFVEGTREAYARDPLAVLQRYLLPRSYRSVLPDVTSAAFLAEARGRKIGVAREVHARFPNTLGCRGLCEERSLATSALFARFLGSSFFMDPERALPHPYGIGRGYENISKFALWLRDAEQLRRPGCELDSRNSLYLEFSIYLIAQVKHARDTFFERFKRGVIWRTWPQSEAAVVLVTPSLKVYRLSGVEGERLLGPFASADLDAIESRLPES